MEKRKECLDNVIDLGWHRRRRSHTATRTLYYVNEDGPWLGLLQSFPFLHVEDVQDEELLRAKLISSPPDLILLDSKLGWASLVDLTAFLHQLIQVPVVLVCHDGPSHKMSRLLKQAYAVGLHDAVFAPLQREELFESLEVLLKFQRQAFLP